MRLFWVVVFDRGRVSAPRGFAVREGRLAGAALDVFPKEPPTGHPILGLDNAIVSPHVAGGSIEANLAAAKMACESVVAVLQGGRVAHCVNPEVYGDKIGSP